MIAGSILLPV